MEECKYITNSQKYFLSFSEILGARIFKKYWHIKGYFNDDNFKLDKNNKNHLNLVISDSKNFTNQHKSGLVAELLMYYTPFIGYGIYDSIKNKNNNLLYFGISVSLCCGIYHGYALMINKYNRIKAEARIMFLEEKEKINKSSENLDIDTDDEIITKNELITVNKLYDKNCKLFITKLNLYIDFLFTEKKQALSFRQFIYDNVENISLEKLCKIHNLDKFRDLYEKFIQKI
jgi:hypothetical protein